MTRSETLGFENEVRIEGLGEEEYLVIDIPVERIEHVYSHREV
mgnify:CR=1 FL=1